MPKERYKIIPAVYLILKKDNKICLSKRINTGYMDGYYSLIAGHVEINEKPSEAMIRETIEESNLIVTEDDIKLSHIQYRNKPGRIDYFYICENWKGELKNNEPDKCSELKFFEINNFPENIVENVKIAIENSLKSIPFSEFDNE